MAKLERGEHTHMTSDGDASVGGSRLPLLQWIVRAHCSKRYIVADGRESWT